MTAAYLLANLPRLMREAEEAREAVLYGGGHGEAVIFAGGRSGGHGDPTAKRALLLLDLAERERLFREVLGFCCALTDEEKRVVVTKWRMPWLGWNSRSKLWNPSKMRTWLEIVTRLESYLQARNRSAGGAGGWNSASAVGPRAGFQE
jgi:hypothetical protein